MLKFSFSILFVLFCYNCFGQQLFSRDSLLLDLPSQQKLLFHFENPQLVRTQLKDYNIGEAELSFQHRKGEYRRAKDAYQQNLAEFNAFGISQIDSFIISGHFKFNRIWEDSLANTLQGINDDVSPFYYFVEKSGRYERQNFNGNVQVRYAGFNPYFQPGLKFDYNMHWTTRSVDPRPNVASVAIRFNPFISSQIGKGLISGGFLFGYGDEESGIAYKNPMYGTSMLFPDRIYYTNQGFGYISQKDSSNMRKYDQYLGANLAYSLQSERIELYSALRFERKITNSTFDQKMRKQYYKRSEFNLQTLNSQTQVHWKQSSEKQHLFFLDFIYQRGLDLNYNLRSANYLVTNTNINLNYAYQNKLWTLGLGGDWQSMDKLDAAAAHQHTYQQLKLQVQIRRIFNIGKNFLETELIPNYTMSLSNKLTVPSTQVNVFTKSIVYPDFDYFNLEPVGVDFNLAYVLPKAMKMRGAKLFLRNQFLTVLGEPNKNNLSLQKDKYNLWQAQIGARFSL
ncbi:hypothetical protein GFH32_07395 [Sphingobacteruim zhuxiongii]|uniref:DUF6850 domain-containing protein n=1 Tax=Sphingobacterium zhuxiongii TaxID=2662364 RepID=A0A5Q0QBA9_9SPHI|nr:hypothetical protein GFH32_07395 [Sphingobacterium sp. dk4302]